MDLRMILLIIDLEIIGVKPILIIVQKVNTDNMILFMKAVNGNWNLLMFLIVFEFFKTIIKT